MIYGDCFSDNDSTEGDLIFFMPLQLKDQTHFPEFIVSENKILI